MSKRDRTWAIAELRAKVADSFAFARTSNDMVPFSLQKFVIARTAPDLILVRNPTLCDYLDKPKGFYLGELTEDEAYRALDFLGSARFKFALLKHAPFAATKPCAAWRETVSRILGRTDWDWNSVTEEEAEKCLRYRELMRKDRLTGMERVFLESLLLDP